jgi:hypothetical protein
MGQGWAHGFLGFFGFFLGRKILGTVLCHFLPAGEKPEKPVKPVPVPIHPQPGQAQAGVMGHRQRLPGQGGRAWRDSHTFSAHRGW